MAPSTIVSKETEEDRAAKRQKLAKDRKYAEKGPKEPGSEGLFFVDTTGRAQTDLDIDHDASDEQSISDDHESGSDGGTEDSIDGSAGSEDDEAGEGTGRLTFERLRQQGASLLASSVEPSEALEQGMKDEEDEDDPAADASLRSQPAGPSGRSEHIAGGKQRRAVWNDDDAPSLAINVASVNRLRKLRTSEGQTEITGGEYEKALRKQHQSLNPRTSWASQASKQRRKRADDESDDDADRPDAEELLVTAGGLLARKLAGPLASGTIETTRVKDANVQEPSNAVVQALAFHPNGQMLLTAGLDKRLRFFQVDGVNNPKLQSVFLQDMPIHGAAFVSGGDQVVAVGRRPFFYVYDINAARVERISSLVGLQQKSLESCAASPAESGDPLVAFLCDQGQIALASLKSRMLVGTLKMNGTVRCAAFSSDGSQLMSSGGDGVVYTWDMRMRRCLSQLVDEGNTDASALAVSANGEYLATGSGSGVVNLHRRDAIAPGTISQGLQYTKPLKSLMNLTTTVDTLAFSPDSQILALGSRLKKDALRLLHVPSGTVFSNWPTSRSPLHYVHSVAFSPHGGFLAIGNAKGRALLYRLHHYAEA